MKKPSKEGLDAAFKIMQAATVIPYTPTDEQIDARMKELTDLGIRDEQEYEGISSSVRQYAISSLSMEMSMADQDQEDMDPVIFVTMNEGLLLCSDYLGERYKMRPASLHEALAIASEQTDE